MTNHALPDLRNHRGKLLAVCLGALSLGLPSSAADVSSQPLAWIHFSRSDKDISLFNGYPMYFVSGGGLEVHLDADPDPEHSLAFMWLCKENPGRGSSRSMKVAVNGNETVRTHPAVEERESAFFWDVVPVSTFGINKRETGNYHIVANRNPDGNHSSVVLQGIRLITDRKQLQTLALPAATRKARFINPGPLTKAENLARKVDRHAARNRIHENWVGEKKLSQNELQEDEFLSAAR